MTLGRARNGVALSFAFVFLISAACSDAAAPPDYFPRHDIVEDHLVSSSNLVRSSSAQTLGPAGINLALTVGPDGDVIGVEKSDTRQSRDARFEAAALAASKRRYRPFLRDGKPVVAKVNVTIDVLPPEDVPAAKIAFPPTSPKTTLIEFAQHSEFGPDYSVKIAGNGEVAYDGGSNVLVEGKQVSRIDPQTVEDLVKQFGEANFLALRDTYAFGGIHDASSRTLAIRVGRKTKQIVDYVGRWAGMPESVATLQNAVVKASGVERWTDGNAETVPALRQAGFDFKSPRAANMLMTAARYQDPSLAFELLNAGAPVRLPSDNDDVGGWTAARNAAAGGHLELFKAIVAVGGLREEDHEQVDEALRAAAGSGNVALAREVLNLHPRIETERGGSTTLQVVTEAAPCKLAQKNCDYPGMIKLLFQAGANPRATSRFGWLAALNSGTKDPEVARALLAAGVDPNSATSGQPLLFDVAYEDVALELVAAGADLTTRGREGDINVIISRRGWERIKTLVGQKPANVRTAAAALIASSTQLSRDN